MNLIIIISGVCGLWIWLILFFNSALNHLVDQVCGGLNLINLIIISLILLSMILLVGGGGGE